MHNIDAMIEASALAWGVSAAQAVALLALPRQRSVRFNALKMRKSTIAELREDGILLKPIGWAPNCYWVTKGYDKLSTHKLVLNGEVFLQNSASFLPVLALDPKSNEAILDLCAAPGGKTTHIAAITRNKANITANDNSRTRFFKMRELFKLYGVNSETTLLDGRFLRKQLAGQQYDKILLDAPCSGEAAINPNNPKTYATWSPSKVKRLSRLQEQLIVVAYDLLKPGGILVYSTCTINPNENELVVNYLLKRRPANVLPIKVSTLNAKNGLIKWNNKLLHPEITKTMRLLPSIKNEAFYAAKLQKPAILQDSEDFYRV